MHRIGNPHYSRSWDTLYYCLKDQHGQTVLVSTPGGSQGHVQVAIPVFVRHQLTFSSGVGGSGKLDITLGPKQTMGRNIEDARIEIPMPKSVLNCTLTATQVTNPSF